MIIKTESGLLLASLLAGSFFLAPSSYAATGNTPASVAKKSASVSPTASKKTKIAGTRPSLYYKRNWGVDVVGVHPVSSGEMLEFRFRVLDEAKASALFDKTLRPYLVDDATGTRFAVPTLENVGTLRQDIAPDPERIYYMIFGNPGRIVKVGSSVDVVIGNFHIDGLIVD